MRAVLDAAEPLAEMLWRGAVLGRRLDTPERRAGLGQDLRQLIGRIAERSVQEAYRQDFDRRLAVLLGRGEPQGAGAGRGRFGAQAHSGGGRRFGPPPALGGQAVRQAAHDPLRLQGEIVLATLVNHPDLIHARLEAVAHMALPAGQLDKLRHAIIDLAARTPDLDVEALKQHLLSQGFTAMLPELLRRAAMSRFTHASADSLMAAEGLDHVLGLMRERAIRQEAEAAARELGEQLTGEAQARFEAARDLALEGESRRRDIDGPERGG
jgi:DNA primase